MYGDEDGSLGSEGVSGSVAVVGTHHCVGRDISVVSYGQYSRLSDQFGLFNSPRTMEPKVLQ